MDDCSACIDNSGLLFISARSGSLPRRLSKTYAFGSSTPRDWSHQQKLPLQQRVYDAKPPPKLRSQTVDSLRALGGPAKSAAARPKPASSRESRPRKPRAPLPPAPSTSRPAKAAREDEEDDALSEPDIKLNQLKDFQQWKGGPKAGGPKPGGQKPAPEKVSGPPAGAPLQKPAVNHVMETESELVFERSEELDTDFNSLTPEFVEERRPQLNPAVKRQPQPAPAADARNEKRQPAEETASK